MNHYDKRDFPLLAASPIAYLDNAATAQRPECVIQAENTFYRQYNANPLRGLYPLSVAATRVCDEAREAVRAFIHAGSSDEIIFTRNTTESLNLVAYSYGLSTLKTGDEIVVSIMEHHSNLLPWQMVCRQTGAHLRFLECEADGRIDLNKAASIIGARTRLVAVTQVSNVLGASILFVRSPIWRIARALCSSLTARRAPPYARGCTGAGRGLLRFFRPQGIRPDGRRRVVWSPRAARVHAALPDRRRDDRIGQAGERRVRGAAL